jgi:ferredoxin-NADP reductase
MGILDTVVPVIGTGLCAIALLQCALWSAQSFGYRTIDRRRHNQRRSDLEETLTQDRIASQQSTDEGWRGFRSFRVDRLVKETSSCTSVYLVPEDAKPIPGFRPGQHLTLRFQVTGQNKPIVRCYSLSDAPGKPYYRISVKQVAPPLNRPELRPGKVSQYINNDLRIGDRIEIKSPAGNFYLHEQTERPIVLLAGGIGITPMISMLEYLVGQQSKRMVLVAHGVNGSSEHAFKNYLENANRENPNIHLLTCYAQASATDNIGVDYHFDGFVSVDLLRQVLPDNRCDIYLCGPPPFMESLYTGLIGWGVPESDICFEAFGPASIGKARKISAEASAASEPKVSVTFANSNTKADWDGSCDSLLELAEANQVEIDSGCRAGSCGTCSTELISGKVTYPDGQKVDCEPGHCLVCIARPDGPAELGA